MNQIKFPVLSKEEVGKSLFLRLSRRYCNRISFRCKTCWSELIVSDQRFATAVYEGRDRALCPICGDDMFVVSFEVRDK